MAEQETSPDAQPAPEKAQPKDESSSSPQPPPEEEAPEMEAAEEEGMEEEEGEEEGMEEEEGEGPLDRIPPYKKPMANVFGWWALGPTERTMIDSGMRAMASARDNGRKPGTPLTPELQRAFGIVKGKN